MIKNENIDSISLNPSNMKGHEHNEQSYQFLSNSTNENINIGASSNSTIAIKEAHPVSNVNMYPQMYIQQHIVLPSQSVYNMNISQSSFMQMDSNRSSCDNMNYPSSSASACSSASSSSSPAQSNNTDATELYMIPSSNYTSLNKSENMLYTSQSMTIGVNNH